MMVITESSLIILKGDAGTAALIKKVFDGDNGDGDDGDDGNGDDGDGDLDCTWWRGVDCEVVGALDIPEKIIELPSMSDLTSSIWSSSSVIVKILFDIIQLLI